MSSALPESDRVDAGSRLQGDQKASDVSAFVCFEAGREDSAHKGERQVPAVVMIVGEDGVKSVPGSRKAAVPFLDDEAAKSRTAEGAAVFGQRMGGAGAGNLRFCTLLCAFHGSGHHIGENLLVAGVPVGHVRNAEDHVGKNIGQGVDGEG